MADLADVETALATVISGILYPNGTGQASAPGVGCYIAPGWPNSMQLDAALLAGEVTVTVYAQPNMEQVTTRFSRDWQVQTNPAATLSAAVATNTVTLGGTVTAGHYVSIIVDQKAYSYAAVNGDTLTSIAATLASAINADWPATTSSSGVITLPAKTKGLIIARVAAPGTVLRELKRQNRGFQIIIWAPTAALRASVSGLVDAALAAIDFLDMPDLTKAWLRYRGSNDSDMQERANLYRRDLFYWAEYATTQVVAGFPITIPSNSVQLANLAGDTGATVVNVQ